MKNVAFHNAALAAALLVSTAAGACTTPAEVAEAAVANGIGEDYTDHEVGQYTVRVYKHEDHFDVAVFKSGCLLGALSNQDQSDVDELLAHAQGQGI